jgi:hypothetical protein
VGKGAGAGRRGKKPHAAGRQFDPRHLEKQLRAERGAARRPEGSRDIEPADDDIRHTVVHDDTITIDRGK